MAKGKLLASELAFQGYFNVKKDLLQCGDGSTHTYTHFTLPTDAVVVIAQTTDCLYIFNREYRHPVGRAILGCPGGKLEPNEDPLLGGQRELLEETGYASSEISLLAITYPMPAMTDQKVYFLFAKNARKQALQKLDPLEDIRVELKSEEELRADLAAGAILDSHLLTGLALVKIL